MRQINIIFIAALSILALIFNSCANKGYPEGGPKDETPPEVTYEKPFSYSTNFDKRRIQIYFNEYVQLKNVSEKFVISPPLEKNPIISLRGKYINVDFNDTLRDNTTYSLDFADAIVDNNEGNPLGFYRYVFSTGPQIDTMELGGQLLHAESYEPMSQTLVMLYETHTDSMPLLELPNYIGLTDSVGKFRITNVRKATYKVYALGDADKNKKYTPESEMFAFLDSLVTPTAQAITVVDTFKIVDKIVGSDTSYIDSISSQPATAFGPSNLQLRMFKEDPTMLYLADESRTEREFIDYVFSVPANNELKLSVYDNKRNKNYGNNWYIKEASAKQDSIRIWITEPAVYKQDTLVLILNYLKTDTLGQRVMSADTTKYTFTDKTATEKKKKNNEDNKPEIKFLNIESNITSSLAPKQIAYLEFERPINKQGLTNLHLYEVIDSNYTEKQFKITQDEQHIRRYNITYDFEEGKDYSFKLDSAMIYDIYGRFNNKYELQFKVNEAEEYGNIIAKVSNFTTQTIFQLYEARTSKSQDGVREFRIVREIISNHDETIKFELLPEGTYKIRAVIDKNKNGKWDTGLYLQNKQPEEIIYLPAEISLRKNFDIEQDFDYNQNYPLPDYSEKKEEDKDKSTSQNF